MIIMGVIRKAASILTLGGVSDHGRHEPQTAAAKAQAVRAGAEAKIAREQAAVIARALQDDEAQRRADLQEVAEEEAEAVPWNRPASS
jgi:phage-related minor tail protein